MTRVGCPSRVSPQAAEQRLVARKERERLAAEKAAAKREEARKAAEERAAAEGKLVEAKR